MLPKAMNFFPCGWYTNFSETACGFVIEFEESVIVDSMNESSSVQSSQNGTNNYGGWEYSRAINVILNKIYYNLPEELRTSILPTLVVSGSGYSNKGVEYYMTLDNVYLLSPAEIYGNTNAFDDRSKNNTRQLDYYKMHNVTTSNNYKYATKTFNGSKGSWWLRSALEFDNTSFYLVSHEDNLGCFTNDYLHGYSPAFRLATGIPNYD